MTSNPVIVLNGYVEKFIFISIKQFKLFLNSKYCSFSKSVQLVFINTVILLIFYISINIDLWIVLRVQIVDKNILGIILVCPSTVI